MTRLKTKPGFSISKASVSAVSCHAAERQDILIRKSRNASYIPALSLSKKSACGGLFRQKLKKCLRPGAQTPRPPGTGGKRQPCGLLPPKAAKRPEGAPEGSVCPVARREACALWALGPKAQSDPKRGSETMSATVREARMIEQPGHLPPKVAKRPEGVSKYKGCARPARRTPIFARERNERWARSAPSAKIERPGKAGRYEFTLEGLRALQTSPNGLFDSLRAGMLHTFLLFLLAASVISR